MRNIIRLAVLLLGMALLLDSCEKAPFLTMDGSRSFTFPDQGGSQAFRFSCNRDWRISSSDTWCKVTPSSGAKSKDEIVVTISCDPNTTYGPRSATLTVFAEDLSEVITVEQKQNDAILLKENEKKVPYEGEVIQIDLETNVEIEASCSSSWIQQQSTKALNSMSLKFAISENDTYEERTAKINIKQNGGTAQETYTIIQEAHPPINLSMNGTANSYIVPPTRAKYAFDAKVKGNSTEQLIGGESVSIVWQYKSSNITSGNVDLIRDLEYDKESGHITFYSKADTGSVLVALKDSQNNIIWSWHLWVTEYDPEKDYVTYMSGAVLQNRYLGADSKEGWGFYYQWGRKDPLISNPRTVQATQETAPLIYSIEHPDVFIYNNYSVTNGDYNNEHSAYWSRNKTTYDPCPPGWKVADGNPHFTNGWDNSYIASVSNGKLYLTSPLCTPDDIFPATGVFAGWGLGDSTTRVFAWTNSGMLYNFYCGAAFSVWVYDYITSVPYSEYWGGSSGGYARFCGANVRCQKVTE